MLVWVLQWTRTLKDTDLELRHSLDVCNLKQTPHPPTFPTPIVISQTQFGFGFTDGWDHFVSSLPSALYRPGTKALCCAD